MNFIGAIAIVASVSAFGFTHRHLYQKPLGTRFVFFGVFSILSIPALLSSFYYFHVLPEVAWFYTLRSWTGSEFLVVFLGAAGGAAGSLLPRWLTVLPLLGSIGLAIVPYLKPIMNPLDQSSLKEQWDGDACLQSTASTCGPASTASILRSFGVDAAEQDIARAAFTSASGTEAWYLARYVRGRGLAARFDFEPTFSTSVGFPAMVGVRIGGFGHFIAVLDASENQVTFVDPLSGKMRLPISDFIKSYQFTGFHMVVSET
jgi:predicted double-glycine peptidase